MQARGTRTVSFYGLTWAMPMVLWQFVFFVFPLCFLVALTLRKHPIVSLPEIDGFSPSSLTATGGSGDSAFGVERQSGLPA